MTSTTMTQMRLTIRSTVKTPSSSGISSTRREPSAKRGTSWSLSSLFTTCSSFPSFLSSQLSIKIRMRRATTSPMITSQARLISSRSSISLIRSTWLRSSSTSSREQWPTISLSSSAKATSRAHSSSSMLFQRFLTWSSISRTSSIIHWNASS